MDDIRFENEYPRTKDTLKEVYRYWYFRRPISVALYAIVAFNIILQILFSLMNYYVDPTNVFISVFIGVFYLALYFIQVESTAKKDRQLFHGNEMLAKILATSDRLYPSRVDSEMYLEFSNVNYAYETKNYIVLIMKKTRLMLILHKNGFTVGDCDGFIALLREKGIKIRGKKN